MIVGTCKIWIQCWTFAEAKSQWAARAKRARLHASRAKSVQTNALQATTIKIKQNYTIPDAEIQDVSLQGEEG